MIKEWLGSQHGSSAHFCTSPLKPERSLRTWWKATVKRAQALQEEKPGLRLSPGQVPQPLRPALGLVFHFLEHGAAAPEFVERGNCGSC